MPNYITYDPASTPVAGRVTGYRKSFPKEREAELGPNFIEDPDLTGITTNSAKVVAGVISNLTPEEITTIETTDAAASLAALKAAAKSIFVSPDSPEHQAINLGFATLIELVVSEINILRSNAGLSARTNNQVKTSFKSTYEAKIDAL
jgi:hypothetical protein